MPSAAVVDRLLALHIMKGEDELWGNEQFREVSGWRWAEILPPIEDLPPRHILKDIKLFQAVEDFCEKLENVPKSEMLLHAQNILLTF